MPDSARFAYRDHSGLWVTFTDTNRPNGYIGTHFDRDLLIGWTNATYHYRDGTGYNVTMAADVWIDDLVAVLPDHIKADLMAYAIRNR